MNEVHLQNICISSISASLAMTVALLYMEGYLRIDVQQTCKISYKLNSAMRYMILYKTNMLSLDGNFAFVLCTYLPCIAYN